MKHSTSKGANIKIDLLADSFAHRYGIYEDFFDSKEIYIEICYMHLSEYYYWMVNDSSEENSFKTRPEARLAAIAKANELYNQLNK